MNSNDEIRAANQAMTNAMAASSDHRSTTEAATSGAPAAQQFTEAPRTVDDVAVAWSGRPGTSASAPGPAAGGNAGPVDGSTTDLAHG
jgi:hypothetical protein